MLVEVKRYYPDLPHGAMVYFIDKNQDKDYGIGELFRNHSDSALQLWYDDLSIEAQIFDSEAALGEHMSEQIQKENRVFIFEYDEGHISDKTEMFR